MCCQLYVLFFSKMDTTHMYNFYPYIVNSDILIFRMAAAVFHQVIGTPHSSLHHEFRENTLRLNSNNFRLEIGVSRRVCHRSDQRNFCVVKASTSQTSVFDPVSSPSTNNTNNSKKKSSKPVILNLNWINNLKSRQALIDGFSWS